MSREPFKTSDTPFAAYLHYHKHVLVTLRNDPNDFKRKVFVFVAQDDTEQRLVEYYGELDEDGIPLARPTIKPTAEVSPGKYYGSVRFMFSKLRELNNDKK